MTKKPKSIDPIGKNILVKIDDEDAKTTESGLVLPSNEEQEQKSTGEVIAVGSLVDNIKVGETVIFGKYAGDDVELDDVKYKILNTDADAREVLAFLRY